MVNCLVLGVNFPSEAPTNAFRSFSVHEDHAVKDRVLSIKCQLSVFNDWIREVGPDLEINLVIVLWLVCLRSVAVEVVFNQLGLIDVSWEINQNPAVLLDCKKLGNLLPDILGRLNVIFFGCSLAFSLGLLDVQVLHRLLVFN